MNERLKAVITGASSGIGRATAQRFAADGYNVCINARREARLQDLVSNLPKGDHVVCPGDYSNSDVVKTMEDTLRARWGHIDVLVNCAGVFYAADAIHSPI